MQNENILAIDPGKDKVGVAILNGKGETVDKMILFTECNNFMNELSKLIIKFKIKYCAMGNGTKASHYSELVQKCGIEKYFLVDEKDTTMLARSRYFQDHPPKGIRRFIPVSFQFPPEPLDAYAAVIIGERFLTLYLRGEFDET